MQIGTSGLFHISNLPIKKEKVRIKIRFLSVCLVIAFDLEDI
jgi:hypothetical protein